MAVIDGVEPDEGGEEANVRLGDAVAHQVALALESLREPVQAVEQPAIRLFVGVLGAGEPAAVDPVVDVLEHHLVDLVDLVPQLLGVQVGRAGAVMGPPLGREVEGDLRVVVGDDLASGDVDDGGYGHPPVVVGEASQVGLLQPLDPEDRVLPALVESERPAPLVVGRPGDAHGEDRLEAQQAAGDDRAVGPGTGTADDQAVAARLNRVAVAAVGGDAGGDVVRVPGELSRGVDVPVVAFCHALVPSPRAGVRFAGRTYSSCFGFSGASRSGGLSGPRRPAPKEPVIRSSRFMEKRSL
jgi:hypothetical protein